MTQKWTENCSGSRILRKGDARGLSVAPFIFGVKLGQFRGFLKAKLVFPDFAYFLKLGCFS